LVIRAEPPKSFDCMMKSEANVDGNLSFVQTVEANHLVWRSITIQSIMYLVEKYVDLQESVLI
jgi:hypothetical protein